MAGIGGSQRSFLQLARHLTERGVEVSFAGESGTWSKSGMFEPFPFHEIPYKPFRPGSLMSGLRMYRLLRSEGFDLVQVNGAYLGFECALPAAAAGVPVVVTLPGGTLPIFPTWSHHPVVCFSRELQDGLVRERGRNRILMVGNRIDCPATERAAEENSEIPSLFELAGQGGFLLAMTSRFDSGKLGAIRHVIEASQCLRRRRKDFRLCLIGGGEKHEEFRRWAERLNREAGGEYLILTGPVRNPVPIIRRADVVLGAGLSVLEGLVFGIPGLIIGEKGFAGPVSSEMIETVEYFNFSGRNVGEPVSPEILAGELDRLLSDPHQRRELGGFGRRYVWEHLDLRGAIPRYLEFYPAVARCSPSRGRESFLAFLFSAGALARTLWRRLPVQLVGGA